MMEQPPSTNNPRRGIRPEAGLAIGIAIGIALGAAINNLAVGIAIGVAIGLVFNEVIARRNRPRQ